VNFNISVRGAERRFLLPDSFVSCKNASNKLNFIDFGGGDAQLKNYHLIDQKDNQKKKFYELTNALKNASKHL